MRFVPPSSDIGLFTRASRWAEDLALAPARRRAGLAFLAGLLAALALPPLDVLPALALAFPVLVVALDAVVPDARRPFRSRFWGGFAIGWAFGFGYFLAGLWWLGVAFVTGGDEFLWLMPLGVLGLPAALAVFPAGGIAIARLMWSRGAGRFAALAFGLGLAEGARATLLTGFPWNGFGQSFAGHIYPAQIVAWIGTDALGVLVVALFATPAALLANGGAFRRWAPVVVASLALAAAWGYGYARLAPTGGERVDFTRLAFHPHVRLRLVQPNHSNADRVGPEAGSRILDRFLELSDAARGPRATGLADATHLVWPEAPFPFVLDREPRALERIRAALPAGTRLITGAVRAEPGEGGRPRFFNSLHLIDREGGIRATYDKVHLVPFGEYLPFGDWLRRLGLREFVDIVGGFSAAPSRRVFSVPGLPETVPLICFESIFPNEIPLMGTGERVFLNVTNDAWFGATPGPYQHLDQSRLRAIEFGQPLIRAANSGISAVIDPFGRPVAETALGRADVLDSPLPVGLYDTLYRRVTWYSFASVMILMGAVGAFGRLRKGC